MGSFKANYADITRAHRKFSRPLSARPATDHEQSGRMRTGGKNAETDEE